MRATDFVTTDGGERVRTHTRRVMVISDNFCASEGGEHHEPADTSPPAESPWWTWLCASIAVVALCCAIGAVCSALSQPKPAHELPRAVAKVMT